MLLLLPAWVFALLWAGARVGLELRAAAGLAFLATLVLLVVAEHLRPHRRPWLPTRREWVVEGAFFLINVALGPANQLIQTLFVVSVLPAPKGALAALSPWLALPLAVLLRDLLHYLYHRACHRRGLLWEWHAIHHLPEKVNLLNTNRVHMVNNMIGAFVGTVPLLLLGFSTEVLVLSGLAQAVQGYAFHSNLDLTWGPLSGLLMTPAHHRRHHDAEAQPGGNFGNTLSLWDRLGDSYLSTRGLPVERVGVADPHRYPPLDDLLGSQLHPMRLPGRRSSQPG